MRFRQTGWSKKQRFGQDEFNRGLSAGFGPNQIWFDGEAYPNRLPFLQRTVQPMGKQAWREPLELEPSTGKGSQAHPIP